MVNCRRFRSPSTAARSCLCRSMTRIRTATHGRRINCCSTRWARPGRPNGSRFMTLRSMVPIRLIPTLWPKPSARLHSSARRTGNSSLVHTFRPSYSTSRATQIIARGRTLCWQRAAPGAESFVSISMQAARLDTSLSSSWATQTMLRLIT